MRTWCERQGQVEVGLIEHEGRTFAALGASVVGRHVTGYTGLKTHDIYQDPWIRVRKDDVIRPDGKPGIHSVISVKPGVTVLALDGEHTGHFHVLLEGEVRITRTYDKQSILMAVTKPGGYFGEIMLLLGIPWLSTVRVSKPSRLFRLNEEHFWRMLSACQCVAREIFREEGLSFERPWAGRRP